MHRSERALEMLHFGFNEESLFLRFDFTPRRSLAHTALSILFYEPRGFVLKTRPLARDRALEFTITTPGGIELKRDTIALGEILEWEIPLLDLTLKPHAPVAFRVRVLQEGIETELYPDAGAIQLAVPTADFASQNWLV